MTPVRLDVFADPVCPWCYVGKANLDRALEAAPDHPFIVQWHPFQLNPDMPREGVAKREWLEDKFGGADKVDAVHDRLREVARAAGLPLNPDVPKRIPNTLDAHRLIHWAGIEGRQAVVVSALFRAYWVEGRDIGNRGVLADIAAVAGMDRATTARLLDSGADADDIAARDEDARKKGVNSVPTWLIAQQYVVSGAQPPELWAQVIEDLRKDQ
ncbi:DsbA family oxidoreductase [Rhodobacter sp.]